MSTFTNIMIKMSTCNAGPFELPNSTDHNIADLPFTIKDMELFVEPDFSSQTIHCKQQLEIKTLKETDELNLDSIDLQIGSVNGSIDNKNNDTTFDYQTIDDKLIIKLPKKIAKGSSINITIEYAAKPKKGFH